MRLNARDAGHLPGDSFYNVYSSSGIDCAPPVAGKVLFTVDANAAVPLSGGVAVCMPSEITTSKDVNIDFTGRA